MEIFSFSSQCCYWNRRWGHKVEHNGLAAVMDLRAIYSLLTCTHWIKCCNLFTFVTLIQHHRWFSYNESAHFQVGEVRDTRLFNSPGETFNGSFFAISF